MSATKKAIVWKIDGTPFWMEDALNRLAEAGEESRARRELTALLDSGREFSEKPAAEALLKRLN